MSKPKTERFNLQRRFGLRIRTLRESRKLTREDLAELSELSPQNIAKIEAGDRFVTADSLDRLATALDMPVNDLFVFNEDVHQSRSPARVKINLLLKSQSEGKLEFIHEVLARIVKEFSSHR